MILGIDQHPAAHCFVEIDDAVRAMTDRLVVFNAHAYDAPEGAVIFQTECIPEQVSASRFANRECWDLDRQNCTRYPATYVPIGWHASMERFTRAQHQDIDVVFSGCINERRARVLQALADRDLNVVVIQPGVYGAERDAVLARSRLALNMLWDDGRIFPALRVAHLVANHVPVLSERARDGWSFVPTVEYGDLVDAAERAVRDRVAAEDNAAFSYERFRAMPMVLPC